MNHKKNIIVALKIIDHINQFGIKKTREISKHLGLDHSFVSIILHNLTKGKVLKARKGRLGGFYLDKNIKNISLFDLYMSFVHMERKRKNCGANKALDKAYEEAKLQAINFMKKFEIESFFKANKEVKKNAVK